MPPSSRPLVLHLVCVCMLGGCIRQGFDEGTRPSLVEDAGSANDQRTLLDGGAITDSMSPNAEAGSTDAATADVATTEVSTPDANAPDSDAADAATPTADLALSDASQIDTSVTIRHVSGACAQSERVVGGSATCGGVILRATQPNGLDAWQQQCRGSTFEPTPAICAGGELATVVHNQQTGTTALTRVPCGAGMRIIGGGCACGIGNVAASHQSTTHWHCGCTEASGITQTSTVLCVSDAIANALGLTVVTAEPDGDSTATATCPTGKIVIGGGCEAAATSLILGYQVALRQHRYEAPNSWFCEMATGSTSLTAQAFCIDAP